MWGVLPVNTLDVINLLLNSKAKHHIKKDLRKGYMPTAMPTGQ